MYTHFKEPLAIPTVLLSLSHVSRYEKVLYQKLPMVDAAAAAGEEGDGSSSDDDLLNPSSSSTTTSAPSTKNPFENT